jgi:hypothetical protein
VSWFETGRNTPSWGAFCPSSTLTVNGVHCSVVSVLNK